MCCHAYIASRCMLFLIKKSFTHDFLFFGFSVICKSNHRALYIPLRIDQHDVFHIDKNINAYILEKLAPIIMRWLCRIEKKV